MPGVEGWGESDIDETVEALEEVYSNPEESCLRAQRAAKKMLNFSWEMQIEKLVQLINNFF